MPAEENKTSPENDGFLARWSRIIISSLLDSYKKFNEEYKHLIITELIDFSPVEVSDERLKKYLLLFLNEHSQIKLLRVKPQYLDCIDFLARMVNQPDCHLKELEVDFQGDQLQAITTLAATLQCTQCKLTNFEYVPALDDIGSGILAAAIKMNGSLTAFGYTNQKGCQQGLHQILEAILSHGKISCLSLCNSDINDENAEFLAKIIKSEHLKLKKLDLTGAIVSSNGMKLILDAISQCELTDLNVEKIPTASCAQSIVAIQAALKINHTLINLNGECKNKKIRHCLEHNREIMPLVVMLAGFFNRDIRNIMLMYLGNYNENVVIRDDLSKRLVANITDEVLSPFEKLQMRYFIDGHQDAMQRFINFYLRHFNTLQDPDLKLKLLQKFDQAVIAKPSLKEARVEIEKILGMDCVQAVQYLEQLNFVDRANIHFKSAGDNVSPRP